ncbi:MAG TPA: hypothetical protein VFZ24_18310 [Longimicrobiales bacterium]
MSETPISAHRRLRREQRLTIAFFALYTLAVIFPGVVPFRGPRPFILGFPLALVWASAWIVLSFFVLLRLDRAYHAASRAPGQET